MANTGYNWLASAYATYNPGSGSTNVDGIAVADNDELTTEEIDLDGYAAAEIMVKAVEDNTGACDGDVTISILGPDSEPANETWQDTDDYVFQPVITPAQNTTRRSGPIRVEMSKCKVHIDQQAGQELAITISVKKADIPPAS